MPDEPLELELRELEPSDSFAGFSLGDAEFNPLKTFLKRDSKKFSEELLARTYVIAEGRKVVAYITLVCGEIASEKETDLANLDGAEYRYDHYPAVKIARLAVSTKYKTDVDGEKLRLGSQLVDFSLGRANEVSSIAGCRFVVVDSKRPAIGFYQKRGFRMIDTDENKARPEPIMFIDLKAG